MMIRGDEMRNCKICDIKYPDDQFYCLRCGCPTDEVLINGDKSNEIELSSIPYTIVAEIFLYVTYLILVAPFISIFPKLGISLQIIFVSVIIGTVILVVIHGVNSEIRFKNRTYFYRFSMYILLAVSAVIFSISFYSFTLFEASMVGFFIIAIFEALFWIQKWRNRWD